VAGGLLGGGSVTGADVTGCCEAGGLIGVVVVAGGLAVDEFGAGATGTAEGPGTKTAPGWAGCTGCTPGDPCVADGVGVAPGPIGPCRCADISVEPAGSGARASGFEGPGAVDSPSRGPTTPCCLAGCEHAARPLAAIHARAAVRSWVRIRAGCASSVPTSCEILLCARAQCAEGRGLSVVRASQSSRACQRARSTQPLSASVWSRSR
jgi:hypothetical protein